MVWIVNAEKSSIPGYIFIAWHYKNGQSNAHDSVNPMIHTHVRLTLQTCYHTYYIGGGQKRLPKFKFSAKFPIGLPMILQIQIKKFENDCYIM